MVRIAGSKAHPKEASLEGRGRLSLPGWVWVQGRPHRASVFIFMSAPPGFSLNVSCLSSFFFPSGSQCVSVFFRVFLLPRLLLVATYSQGLVHTPGAGIFVGMVHLLIQGRT